MQINVVSQLTFLSTGIILSKGSAKNTAFWESAMVHHLDCTTARVTQSREEARERSLLRTDIKAARVVTSQRFLSSSGLRKEGWLSKIAPARCGMELIVSRIFRYLVFFEVHNKCKMKLTYGAIIFHVQTDIDETRWSYFSSARNKERRGGMLII